MLPLLFLVVLVSSAPLEVSLNSPTLKVNPSVEPYDVRWSITNTQTKPLIFLKWNTPLDYPSPFPSDMFYIRSVEGPKSPVYIGIAQKRSPVPEDLVTIQPGETIQVSINLLKGYWFSAPGEYEVMFSASIFVYEGLGSTPSLREFQSILVASSSISVVITGVAPQPAMLVPAPPRERNNSLGNILSFKDCSTALQDQSRTADSNALNLLNNVNNYFSGLACGDTGSGTRYGTWFGACTTTRLTDVRGHFTNIRSQLQAGYNLVCSSPDCSPGVFAFVYPNDRNFNVYVCSAYVSASANCAWDSKPGTLIHELSHFTSVAGTQDYAYGTSACQNLASSNPDRAINNADNHEYMSECSCNGC